MMMIRFVGILDHLHNNTTVYDVFLPGS